MGGGGSASPSGRKEKRKSKDKKKEKRKHKKEEKRKRRARDHSPWPTAPTDAGDDADIRQVMSFCQAAPGDLYHTPVQWSVQVKFQAQLILS